jgi:hypothetical protein
MHIYKKSKKASEKYDYKAVLGFCFYGYCSLENSNTNYSICDFQILKLTRYALSLTSLKGKDKAII